jgi:hypothetical protein
MALIEAVVTAGRRLMPLLLVLGTAAGLAFVLTAFIGLVEGWAGASVGWGQALP